LDIVIDGHTSFVTQSTTQATLHPPEDVKKKKQKIAFHKWSNFNDHMMQHDGRVSIDGNVYVLCVLEPRQPVDLRRADTQDSSEHILPRNLVLQNLLVLVLQNLLVLKGSAL
jgi:hypothetical protein